MFAVISMIHRRALQMQVLHPAQSGRMFPRISYVRCAELARKISVPLNDRLTTRRRDKPNTHIEVLPRSKSYCSGALFYYLSAQIKQNSVFYANFQNRIINRFFGQAFSRKKSLRVEGGALVALRRERNPHTSCAPQGVNFKTVRWTVLKEGTPCKRGRPPQKHNVKILLY